MDSALITLLQDMIEGARTSDAAAKALGTSLIAALPFKVGDVINYAPQVDFRVHRITFDMHCHMHDGVWRAGYAAMGPQTIGSTSGSTNRRALFNIDGTRAVLTT